MAMTSNDGSGVEGLASCASARKDLLCKIWLTPLTEEEAADAAAEVDGSSPSCLAMTFCDTVFRVTDCLTDEVRLFPASRAILASSSDYFKRMLFGEMSEAKFWNKNETPIAINGLTIKGFQFMLALGYGFDNNDPKLDAENCVAVLQCADYFLAKDIRNICLQKLRELLSDSYDASTAIQIIDHCNATGVMKIPEVREILSNLMSRRGFLDNILKSEEFKRVTPEIVLMIMKAGCSSLREDTLWTKIVEWSRFQYEQAGEAISEDLIRIINNQSKDTSPVPPCVVHDYKSLLAQEHFNDFRDVLAPLLPFFRFPCMDGIFFSDEVAVMEILNYKVVASIFRVIVGSSLASAPFLFNERTNSFIFQESEKTSLLSKAFPNRQRPQLSLLYRGSEHDFSAKTFHEMCNYKGPTLSVVETEYGHVIGGYNSLGWGSRNMYRGDDSAFLFISRVKDELKSELRQKQLSLPIVVHSARKGQHDIYDHVEHGPTFGGGHCIYISDLCYANKHSHCSPHVSYLFQVDGQPVHTSWFVGHRNISWSGHCNFGVKEYEVFAVV